MRINSINTPVTKKLEIYASQSEKKIKAGKVPTAKDFSAGLYKYRRALENEPNIDSLIKKISLFAERLVGIGYSDLAGIVYSFLLKIAPDMKLTEEIAIKELALAKRTRDPIHICARISDIEKIYKSKAPKSPEHIKWLRENTKHLRKLINHYDHAKRNYKTIKTEAKPIEYYQRAFANSNLNLAKATMQQTPKEALQEIQESIEIIKKLIVNGQTTFDIIELEKDLTFANLLLNDVYKILKK